MKITNSPAFEKLSQQAKLLLTLSFSTEKKITELVNHSFFFKHLGLKFPEDEMTFIYIVEEIHQSGIDYRLEKIKFIAPELEDVLKYLRENAHRFKKVLNLSQQTILADRFMSFYGQRNWKVGTQKMVNWKIALTQAVNTWNIKSEPNKQQTNMMATQGAFQEFMNIEI